MKTAARIFGMLIWLGGLALAGSIILMLTASRVGEHRSSTYGDAYVQFQNSWGGEIGIIPPKFNLKRTYTVTEYNKDAERDEIIEKTEQIPLIPKTIKLESTVEYGEQDIGLLPFNAFEAKNTETYVIPNPTGYSGELLVDLTKPNNANLMYDYTVTIPARDNQVLRPLMGQTFVLMPTLPAGEDTEIIITYATKGMDIFKYNLSAYQDNVIDNIQADIKLNTHDFEIYRFGLPHKIEPTSTGANIQFEVNNFSTTQDLGVTFTSKQIYLDQIQSLITYTPISLVLFLLVIFVFSQIYAVKFNPLHYLFVGIINVFYFLFVAYLIRFFGVWLTFGISIVLTTAMFLAYCPNVFGWRFASRIAGVYLFLLTVVFSLIFLMPIFRGLLFVVLVFLVFMSIMIGVSRSDISQWHIVGESKEAPETPPEV